MSHCARKTMLLMGIWNKAFRIYAILRLLPSNQDYLAWNRAMELHQFLFRLFFSEDSLGLYATVWELKWKLKSVILKIFHPWMKTVMSKEEWGAKIFALHKIIPIPATAMWRDSLGWGNNMSCVRARTGTHDSTLPMLSNNLS